ncbi:MAG: nitronate monooxygenase [Saprospiraceae bacterium]|nr:nitronate monooxygenase [Saprospiraceae bacterium]
MMSKSLTEILHIRYPLIMAPMFLVSNMKMSLAASQAGIAACIPALNYRNHADFIQALAEISESKANIGINLIANKSNYKLNKQLEACLQYKIPFIISSLGNPKEIIEKCRPLGIKVFCDVSTMEYAEKTAKLNPDALIAVTSKAGGHLGPHDPEDFIPQLLAAFPQIPIITAGGVGDAPSYLNTLKMGVSGISAGTVFIASNESPVCEAYKQACVDYTENDVITTTKLSGIPCTIINTPYVQKTGNSQNALQRFLNRNKTFKKWFKLFVYKNGMHTLQKAAFDQNYQNVWCAGKSIRFIKQIRPVEEIVRSIVEVN